MLMRRRLLSVFLIVGLLGLALPVSSQVGVIPQRGGGSTVPVTTFSESITLTDAQIRAADTKYTLVEVPAGKVAVPLLAAVRYDIVEPYTNVNENAAFRVVYSTSELLAGGISGGVAGLLGYSGDTLEVKVAQGQRDNTDDGLGQNLVVQFTNETDGDFTAGDPANAITITVHYVLIDVE
jgi:hypothetical protein